MTMIDRVARVLQSHMEAAFVHGFPDDLSFVADDLARAALDAMREPTEPMVEAAWEHTADPCWRENVADAWRAAIDAALSE